METLKVFNTEGVSEEEQQKFEMRRAVRAVILDEDNNIALLYSERFEYYELPGGGIDERESKEAAFVRECKEETGCDVKIIAELGKTIEVRKQKGIVNETFGYLARVVGKKGEPKFLDHEQEDNFSLRWVPIEEAIRNISSNKRGENLYHDYITERALVFLNYARVILEK